MRILATVLLLVICSTAQAQVATEQTSRQSAQQPAVVEVIYLKYLKSTVAEKMLKELGVEGKIVADTRLNAVVVSAQDDNLKKIKAYIEKIDTAAQDNEVTAVYETDAFQQLASGGELVKQIADASGVNVAFDQELGIVMIKGPKEEVSRTTKIIEQIQQLADSKKSQKRQAESLAVRVLWLSNDPSEDSRNPMEPDAELKKSIAKLAELGFPNMKLKLQVLGRCDVTDGESLSQIEGSATTVGARRTLSAQAKLSHTDGSPMNGRFNLEASFTDLSSTEVSTDTASVEVTVNLVLKKYYILSATPVGGYQTAFVVQLVDGM